MLRCICGEFCIAHTFLLVIEYLLIKQDVSYSACNPALSYSARLVSPSLWLSIKVHGSQQAVFVWWFVTLSKTFLRLRG